ncbi:MAG: chemotaxis protein CheX [Candidatus Riflebacteria bacterium]|nr:chemotaxis protein CheX [Candidatus Riflebacteria bacterium]
MPVDANILNQFISSAISVFEQVASIRLVKNKLSLFQQGYKFPVQVATILGLTGSIRGQIVVSFDEQIAMKLTSAILMGEPVTEFNEVTESTVCEIANMIGGDSAQRLHAMGHTIDVAVPSFIRGKEVSIGFSPNTDIFFVEYGCDWGKVNIIFNIFVVK